MGASAAGIVAVGSLLFRLFQFFRRLDNADPVIKINGDIINNVIAFVDRVVFMVVAPPEIEKDEVTVSRRDTPAHEKSSSKTNEFIKTASKLLTSIQNSLYDNALRLLKYNTKTMDSKSDFYDFFTPKNAEKPEIHGGFVLAYFKEDAEIEKKIQEDLNVSIRCIPLEEENNKEEGKCLFTGKPTKQKVIFGKAY